MPAINRTVLMSDADNFSVKELNPYSDEAIQPNSKTARQEHDKVKVAIEQAGIKVIQVPSPKDCQDGVYTANWAFCLNGTAVMAHLPNIRQKEEAYAAQVLRRRGLRIVEPPEGVRYSGQGDTLLCGDTLFLGSRYRTDLSMFGFLKKEFPDRHIVNIQTVPQLDSKGKKVVNGVSGWPDSFFYDIDLAMGILKPGLIAWCPEAFLPESRKKIEALKDIDKIEIDVKEAMEGFACNFISTGHTVVMGANAPKLQAAIESKGLTTITVDTPELNKGGGFIRCVALTLDNQ